MNAKAHLRAAVALFSLVSLACSLTGLVPGRSGPDSGATVYDENGQPVTLEAPAPDFLTVLNDRVAAGEIGEGEALIAALKLLAGEDSQSDLFAGQEATALEGTGLISQAVYFLENNPDQAASAEIERLLQVILPSRDALDRFSQPEAGGSARRPRPSRPVPAGDEAACRALWKAGFPADAASLVCVLYYDFTLYGAQFRVYYPESRRDDPGYLAYVQAAEEALRQSVDVYRGYSSFYSDLDIIFTLVEPGGFASSGPPRASVPSYEIYRSGSDRCPVIIYPAAFLESIEDFRQIVAHEIFHCFTIWRQGGLQYRDATWYLEGMANYFSNLVYPANDLEFRFQPNFDRISIDKSIFHMSYANTIFFQYLGNLWGNGPVFALLDELDPLASHADHAAALVSNGVTQQVFQEFGQAYVDMDIADSGGAPYPITLYYRDVIPLETDRQVELEAEPFHLARYLLRYKDEGRTEYRIAQNGTGLPGRNIAQRWPGLRGPWRPLPASFTSRCGADGDRLLLTTVEPEGTYTLELDVNVDRTLECDCIVGTWVQDTPEIESHLRTVLPSSMSVEYLSGQFLLVVDQDGTMTFTPRDYRIGVRTSNGLLMEVSISGAVVSTYVLPEEEANTIVVTSQDTRLVINASVDGSTVAVPLSPETFVGGPFSAGGSWQYECSDTTLTAIIPAGVAPFATSSFERLSDLPETPIPEEPIDEPGGLADESPLDTTDGGGAAGICPDVRAEDFSIDANRVSWTLHNDGLAPVRISALSLNWPPANGGWTRIELDGELLWTGSLPSGPARIEDGWSAAAEAFSLDAGAEAGLVLHFTGTAGASGYILVVDLADGCILSDAR